MHLASRSANNKMGDVVWSGDEGDVVAGSIGRGVAKSKSHFKWGDF